MARDHTLRAGKRMAWESADGAAHPNSFWCAGQIAINIEEQSIRLKFLGYHDAAAYDAGKLPVAGAEKSYLITEAGFESAAAMVTQAANIPISAEILRLAWVAALETHDVEDPETSGQHPPAMVSFFASAEAVA